MKNVAISLVLFALSLLAHSQNGVAQMKTPKVGVLMLIKPDRPHLQGLRNGLKEAGYIEGQNLTLVMRPLQSAEELRSLAKDYVQQKINVIVTTGNVETKIAKETTQEVPIVFMPASDPVRSGFVKSLARPGTNLTGLTYYVDLRESAKQLEIFKEIVSTLRRAVLLIDDRTEAPIDATSVAVIRKVAVRLGIELIEKPVKSLDQAERAISSLSKDTTDGILVICTSLFSNLEKIAVISRQKLVPVFGCASAHVTENGALFSYAPDMYKMGHRGAWYVGQILKGAKPQELPVEAPRKFELVINLKTAELIGIKIPPEVLQRADKVIK
jgi:ABC-type uncharacterized transport system substrate-binding protein